MVIMKYIDRYAAAARSLLVSSAVALLLLGLVYLTLGTRWGFEKYVFRYVIVLSFLPLVFSLVTRRYRFIVPSLLVSVGVVAFVGGILWNGLFCLEGGTDSWQLVYQWQRNVILFDEARGGQLACQAEPNRLVTMVGYMLTTAGILWWLDLATESNWLLSDIVSTLKTFQ